MSTSPDNLGGPTETRLAKHVNKPREIYQTGFLFKQIRIFGQSAVFSSDFLKGPTKVQIFKKIFSYEKLNFTCFANLTDSDDCSD